MLPETSTHSLTDSLTEPEFDPNDISDPETDPQAVLSQSAHETASWVVSLLFWLTLVAASLMYSAVALSPKLAEWIAAQEVYIGNAARLVELEDDVEYLERVRAALESDPEFALRLARASLPDTKDRTNVVPVASELLFGGLAGKTDRKVSSSERPLLSRTIFHLASHQPHRQALLISSILLTILGFTFLNDSESGSLRSIGRGVLWVVGLPARRYRRESEPAPSIAVSTTDNAGAGSAPPRVEADKTDVESNVAD